MEQHHEGWTPRQLLPVELAVMRDGGSPDQASHDELWATVSYAAAVVTWLIAPLVVYLTRGRRSEFVRRHAAQAFSFMLTVTVFAISGAIIAGLLSLDSARDALYVMGPVFFVFVLIVLWYLARAARAAGRGEFYRLPRWLCIQALRF
jgi:uncharacterized Tic20 family protein